MRQVGVHPPKDELLEYHWLVEEAIGCKTPPLPLKTVGRIYSLLLN